MTLTLTPARRNAAVEDYANGVFREVVRLLARRRPLHCGDIAADVAATVLEGPEVIMAKYADPCRYARVAARHAGISFDRHERAQRGEGVRLVKGPDGHVVPRRPVISGNAPIGESGTVERFDGTASDDAPFADRVVAAVADAIVLERCLAGLPHADCELLLLVDGMGYTVQELAGHMGQARETVSRRLNRIRGSVQQNRVGMTRNAQGVTT